MNETNVKSPPRLSSSRSTAHKAALLFLHLSLSLAMALTSSQDFQPAFVLSFSTVRRQVALERPTFLLPIGVQVSAVTQWCSLGILRTCPKNLHLLQFSLLLHSSLYIDETLSVGGLHSVFHPPMSSGSGSPWTRYHNPEVPGQSLLRFHTILEKYLRFP